MSMKDSAAAWGGPHRPRRLCYNHKYPMTANELDLSLRSECGSYSWLTLRCNDGFAYLAIATITEPVLFGYNLNKWYGLS